MSTTIGADCHITLTHAQVSGGAACGFILEALDRDLGPDFSIQREVSSDGTVSVKVFFDILLADNLINPDGSTHSESRSAMYAKIIDYLSRLSGITLATPVGVLGNLGGTGHVATESHFGGVSKISCQLNNAGTYYPPVDQTLFYASVWDGTLTWSTSYWR